MADDRVITEGLIGAFVRLAQGDLSVRLPRNFTRDTDDTLAYFVNLIAEEFSRLLAERDGGHRQLEQSVKQVSERLLALASGDFSARAERTGDGGPIDVLAYLFNNTAEEVGNAFGELERQRGALQAILESMLDGVVLLDASGHIQRVNAAVTRLLGFVSDDLVTHPVGDLLGPEEAQFAAAIIEQLRKGPFSDRDTRFRTAAGEAVSMALSGSPQRGPGGLLEGAVLAVRDDRELKAAQAHLQMTDRLAVVGTVAAGVAHEINNPLSFVVSNLDFVSEEIAEIAGGLVPAADRLGELVGAINDARRGAGRVREIVKDLKAFSRVDKDSVKPLDIRKVVESSMTMIKNEMRHHSMVVLDLGAAPTVEGNEGRLGQVFLNLLQNAAQAIPPGQVERNTIRVATGTLPDGSAFFSVQDTGAGIPPENLKRIFDAFFTTKPVGVGTGLGLSICHKFVSGMGGRIEVESAVGVGSTFRVVLPPSRAVSEPAGVVAAVARASKRRRILVVDDEAEVGQSIRRILGRDHDVDVVTRAKVVPALVAEAHYDLVLSDLMMPEMTGMQLHATLAASRPDVAARMAFMTGGAFSPEARTFLDHSPHPRIDKPFDARTLRELVASLEARPTPERA